MDKVRKTPIVLITGSLGSGKTTLLRHMLEWAPFRIAVLMNEFGETAIDSKIIGGKNIDIVELAGGCVCCSMTGEFEAAVREIIEAVAPGFIVVEATGVAEADALVFEVEDSLPEVRLDSVVCIVDAFLGTRHPHVGYSSRTQIASADIVLVNKADLVTSAESDIIEAQVRKFNQRAAVLRTINCALDMNLIFGQAVAQERGRRASGRSESIPSSGAGELSSFVWTSERPLESAKFDELVRRFPPGLIRAKGFILFEDAGRLFNYVAGRVDFEDFSVKRTELVFIGRGMGELRPGLEEELRNCRNA